VRVVSMPSTNVFEAQDARTKASWYCQVTWTKRVAIEARMLTTGSQSTLGLRARWYGMTTLW